MTQAQGSQAYIALQKETTYGADPATPDLVKLPFTSESLSKSVDLVTSDTLRGNRNSVAPVRGNTDVGGSVNFNLAAYPGQLLLGVLGDVATTGVGPYVHTIKVGNGVPSFVVEKGLTDINQFFKYNGCKVSRFSLTATPSGFQQASVDFLGASGAASGTSFDGTLTDLGVSEFDGFRINSILEGGGAISGVTEVSISVDNGLDGDTFTVGSGGVRGSINDGIVKVTGSIKGLFEDLTLYNKAVNQTESSLKVVFQFGTGDGSAGNEYLDIEIPELVYSISDPPVEGPRGLMYALNFEAYYDDDAAGSAMVMTLKNTQAAL